MGSTNRVIACLVLAVATAMAGCAANTDNGNPATNESGQVASEADARLILQESVEKLNATDRLAVDIAFTSAGSSASFVLATDKATDTLVMRAEELPSIPMAGVQAGSSFTVWSKAGLLVVYDGANATVLPADGDSAAGDQFKPGDNPLGVPESPFTAPLAGVFDTLQDDANLTVESVEATLYKGKNALRIIVTHTEDDGTLARGNLVVYLDSRLPAMLEAEETSPDGSKSHVVAKFLYGEEVGPFLDPGNGIARAATLATTSEARNSTTTFTFVGTDAALVALAELEIRLVEPGSPFGFPGSGSDDGNGTDPEESFRLRFVASDGNASAEGISATFEDVDGDGFVTPGDRILVTESGEGGGFMGLALELMDLKTGTRVTPAWGALGGLFAALGAAAVLGRRRS